MMRKKLASFVPHNPLPRIGIGYDIHRFTKGRKFILGGVRIPSKTGLLGHSDADVLLHAVCDALLGAASLGDIGKHFPINSRKYKGISSLILLKHVGLLVSEKGYEVGNIDVTVILQSPKISRYTERMQKNIARALHLPSGQISIKATTNEHLGALGRTEGAAAFAVALVASRPV
ncbi:MAG: 2-C-methyl-D-erythritol 2,4-cyclodiphosphate synthase [Bacteroidota bacterium]